MTRPEEAATNDQRAFVFQQTDKDRGLLTYRCCELVLESQGERFDVAELQLIQDIVACLNEHFA